MENTLENKAKFLSLYWGQEQILSYNGNLFDLNYINFDNVINRVFTDRPENTFLLLNSIVNITDEHAYEVGKVINCWNKSERKSKWFQDDEMRKIHIMGGRNFAESIGKEWGHGLSHPFANNSTDILAAYDILRNFGYALPYMELSVEKLIEYSWIKLKN